MANSGLIKDVCITRE